MGLVLFIYLAELIDKLINVSAVLCIVSLALAGACTIIKIGN